MERYTITVTVEYTHIGDPQAKRFADRVRRAVLEEAPGAKVSFHAFRNVEVPLRSAA
jgi:hypothetical protein